MDALTTTLGRVTLKNPLIAGAAEHLIDAAGVRRALQTGVGRRRGQVHQRDAGRPRSASARRILRARRRVARSRRGARRRRPTRPSPAVPDCIPSRSKPGSSRRRELDREAKTLDSYAVASLILAELDPALRMARADRGGRHSHSRAQYRHALCDPSARRGRDRARARSRSRDRHRGSRSGFDTAMGKDHRPERARARPCRRGLRERRRRGGHGRPPPWLHSRREHARPGVGHDAWASAAAGTCP